MRTDGILMGLGSGIAKRRITELTVQPVVQDKVGEM
jgi:hypothetical protein